MPRLVLVLLVFSTISVDGATRGRASRPPVLWGMPACDGDRVGQQHWYSVNNAIYTPPSAAGPQAIALGDVPNLTFAMFDGSLYESRDGGCDWKLRAKIGGPARIAALPGQSAYVWTDTQLFRVTRQAVEPLSVPDRLLLMTETFALAFNGTAYESADRGLTWQRRGAIANAPLRAAAVDPHDGQHVIAAATGALWQSSDGGRSWTSMTAPEAGEFTSVAFAPSEPGVVWLAGRSAIYRSTGANFTRVATSTPLVSFNGPPLAAHPLDAMTVAFTVVNGVGILDLNTNKTKVAMVAPPDSLIWAPHGLFLYTTTPQTTLPIF
jgi:hypothetical protein